MYLINPSRFGLSSWDVYEELLACMARKEPPRILAPWIEYSMNFTDHSFSDGCGKVSQLLAAFICMRAGHASA